ncbi:MAG: hypothetical protein LBE91_01305 [Tannerella sp.]|jgi:hypothetical protein|nr:hypothetical protein [Tannerella sp.]
MKVNKKAILGMLVAMVMSLGVMGGINKSFVEYGTIQQYGYACWLYSGQCESTLGQAAWQTAGGALGGVATATAMAGIATGGLAIPAGIILCGVILA